MTMCPKANLAAAAHDQSRVALAAELDELLVYINIVKYVGHANVKA